MGWCEGSYLAEELWGYVKPYVPEDKQSVIAATIMELFQNHDADDFSDDMDIVKTAHKTKEEITMGFMELMKKLNEATGEVLKADEAKDVNAFDESMKKLDWVMLQLANLEG